MVETDKKAVAATFIVVKGKTKGEMLLGCDTVMELGVLKIVNNIDKEDEKLRPVVDDIVSEYLTIILLGLAGYEMIYKQRGA